MESKQFLEEFQAGRRERTAGYQYFVPNPINRQWKWKDAQLNTLLEKASRIYLGNSPSSFDTEPLLRTQSRERRQKAVVRVVLS